MVVMPGGGVSVGSMHGMMSISGSHARGGGGQRQANAWQEGQPGGSHARWGGSALCQCMAGGPLVLVMPGRQVLLVIQVVSVSHARWSVIVMPGGQW